MTFVRLVTALTLGLTMVPAASACGADFDAMFPSVHVVAETRRLPGPRMSRRTLRILIHAVREMQIKPYATLQPVIAEL